MNPTESEVECRISLWARASGDRLEAERLPTRTFDVRTHFRSGPQTRGCFVDSTSFDAVAKRIGTTTGRRDFAKSIGALALGGVGILGLTRAASARVSATDKRQKCLD